MLLEVQNSASHFLKRYALSMTMKRILRHHPSSLARVANPVLLKYVSGGIRKNGRVFHSSLVDPMSEYKRM